jgi:chitinase
MEWKRGGPANSRSFSPSTKKTGRKKSSCVSPSVNNKHGAIFLLFSLWFLQELILDAHSKNIMPILSVGGASFGEEWLAALESGAADLGGKLADIAVAYNVGIEVDFEDNNALDSPALQQQILSMAAAFRVRAGNDRVFTVDVGAAAGGSGYFLNNLFQIVHSSGYFSWVNAEVDNDGGSHDSAQYQAYWEKFIGQGEENIVVSLWAKGGTHQACAASSETLVSAMEWVSENGFGGMMFWQIGLDDPTNCPGLVSGKASFLGSVDGNDNNDMDNSDGDGAGNDSGSDPPVPGTVPAPAGVICEGEPCVSGKCRSEWGFCGAGEAYCNEDSTWHPECEGGSSAPPPSPAVSSPPLHTFAPSAPTAEDGPPPTSAPTSVVDLPPSTPVPLPNSPQCTGEPCTSADMCRSEWGFCGADPAHCNHDSTWQPSCAGHGDPSFPTLTPVSEPEPEPSPTAGPTTHEVVDIPFPVPAPTVDGSSLSPSSSPPPRDDSGAEVVGYYTSWYQYSDATVDLSAEEAAMLTRVNYAFATIQYAPTLDVWYLAPTDAYADMDKCFDGACYGNQPDVDAKCIKLDDDAFTFYGSPSNPTLNLAPYIGSGDAGRTLNQPGDCFFAGGSPTSPRSPSCMASLHSVQHPTMADSSDWLSKRYPTVCGLYAHTLRGLGEQEAFSHIRWLISVGGWYDANYFTEATKPQYRASFIQSIVKYVEAFGFDGVDLDWEFPGFEHGQMPLPGKAAVNDGEDAYDCASTTCQEDRSKDGAQLVAFLQELREAFDGSLNRHGEAHLVTMASPSGYDKLSKFDMKSVCDNLDAVNIMSYDMSGAWEAVTQHQAPLYEPDPGNTGRRYSVDDSISLFLEAGCLSEKIIMGIPFYARQFNHVAGCDDDVDLPGLRQPFSGPSTQTCVASPADCVPSYKQIASNPNLQTILDPDSGAAYSLERGTENGCVLYSYDTPAVIELKGDYATTLGLGGFMYWAIGEDSNGGVLLESLHAQVEKMNDASDVVPTSAPSANDDVQSSAVPTGVSTAAPSTLLTAPSAASPAAAPTDSSSAVPSVGPSAGPTAAPTTTPTAVPSAFPTVVPSMSPSPLPTEAPSFAPSSAPSTTPFVATYEVLGSVSIVGMTAADFINDADIEFNFREHVAAAASVRVEHVFLIGVRDVTGSGHADDSSDGTSARMLLQEGSSIAVDFEIRFSDANSASVASALLMEHASSDLEAVASFVHERGFETISIEMSYIEIFKIEAEVAEGTPNAGSDGVSTAMVGGVTAGVVCGVAIVGVGLSAFRRKSEWEPQKDEDIGSDELTSSCGAVSYGTGIEMNAVASVAI